MQTWISSEGEIVLPEPLLEELGFRPEEPLDATVEAGRLVITQPAGRRPGAGIITDPDTGWPVLTGGEGAPALTSEMVAAILADFP